MATGKAYAYFKCRKSKKEIEQRLPQFRRDSKTPSNLELSLYENTGDFKFNKDNFLNETTKEAKEHKINYILEATYPDASNEKTADELSAVLNQAYQSPLYNSKGKEPFTGKIFYKNRGNYQER